MKTFISLLAVTALAMIPLSAIGHGESSKSTKGDRVYCCHEKGPERGKCDKLHTKEDCEKEGGKVVTSCKECK